MSTNSFLSNRELKKLGLASYGEHVLISRHATIYSPHKIAVGNHVRIDDFCVLSGRITLGNYIHIAAYTGLFGADAGIEVGDYSTISSRGAVYAVTDDYSGETMTNPMVPEQYRGVQEEKVLIGKHVVMGTNCTVLPGVSIEEGTAIGACSLINQSTKEWGIYYGIPCKRMQERKRNALNLEHKFY